MCEAVMDQTHAVHGHARGRGAYRCGRLPTALRRTGAWRNDGRCAFAIESPCITCCSVVSSVCHPLFAGPAAVQHMTAFATHPGAFSRESISAVVRNGFFTGALKNKLRSQGKTTDIRHLLGSVRDDVLEATGGRQQPYTAGSLHGDLCLVVPSDELEPVRPAWSLRASDPACTAFNVPLFSIQIAVDFRASLQAGHLEALLRHLSSGESPTQSFVSNNRALAHACLVPSSLSFA